MSAFILPLRSCTSPVLTVNIADDVSPTQHMKCTLFNARFVHNKWSEIALYVNSMMFDTIGICKTWLSNNDDVVSYYIFGNTFFAENSVSILLLGLVDGVAVCSY